MSSLQHVPFKIRLRTAVENGEGAGRLTEEEIWALRSSNSWQIIPVNFQKRHRQMLEWTYTLMSKRFIKIHPSLQKLIVSLRTTIVSDDWKLDKQQTSHHDILDGFRLACLNYEIPNSNI